MPFCLSSEMLSTTLVSPACDDGWLPAMRQQLLYAAGALRGQALKHVLYVSVRIVPVEPNRVHEANDRSGAFARTQAPATLTAEMAQPGTKSLASVKVILVVGGRPPEPVWRRMVAMGQIRWRTVKFKSVDPLVVISPPNRRIDSDRAR